MRLLCNTIRPCFKPLQRLVLPVRRALLALTVLLALPSLLVLEGCERQLPPEPTPQLEGEPVDLCVRVSLEQIATALQGAPSAQTRAWVTTTPAGAGAGAAAGAGVGSGSGVGSGFTAGSGAQTTQVPLTVYKAERAPIEYDTYTKPATYDEDVAKVETQRIFSIAFFVSKPVFDASGHTTDQSRIVAYRLLLGQKDNGMGGTSRYFFQNLYGLPDLYDIKLTDLTSCERYALDQDDRTDETESSIYGYNGFDPSVPDTDPNYHTELILTFKNESPMHGDLEALTSGEYHLWAVVNFVEVPAVVNNHTLGRGIFQLISYWWRHKDEPGFDGIPPNSFADAGALDGVFPGYNLILKNYTRLSDSRVEGAVHSDAPEQDVLISDSYLQLRGAYNVAAQYTSLYLQNGTGHYSFHPQRNTSRVTIVLDNECPQDMRLVVPDLRLSDDFSAAAVFLFLNHEVNFPIPWEGAPVLTSPRALWPYNPNVAYTNQGDHILFDGLVVPTSNPAGPLSIAATFQLPDVGGSHSSVLELQQRTISDLLAMLADSEWAIDQEKEFALQNVRTSIQPDGYSAPTHMLFIKAGVNANAYPMGDQAPESATPATLADYMESDISGDADCFIWVLAKQSDNSVKIKSKSLDQWIKVNGNSSSGNGNKLLFDTYENASVFTLSNSLSEVSDAIMFTTTYGGTNVYLHMLEWRNAARNLVSIAQWGPNERGGHFYLYQPVEVTFDVPTKHIDVPIMAFTREATYATPLYALPRNSHLKILLRVRYNEHSNVLEGEVLEWDQKDNYVTFD